MNILIFGDSITWGAWDVEGGWVARIKKVVDQKVIDTNFDYYNEVYNVGISGDMSTDLLERFDFETNSRIYEEGESSFVFAIGTNDCMFDVNKKIYRTPSDIFRDNVLNLIKKARKFSSKVVFVGLFPVDDDAIIPPSWPQNEVYKNKYISEYNKIVKDVCSNENIEFIDLLEVFKDKDYQSLLVADGLHPNSEGHKQISEVVLKFLTDNEYI